MNPFIIGAIANAMRGGQWRIWLGGEWNKHDADGKPIKWRWLQSDFINEAIYGVTIFVLSENWLLALASVAGMAAGARPGWGDYIGAILKTPDDKLQENKFIDPLIRWLERWPFWWGFAGLAIRGAWWGLCLATPFWLHGHGAVALGFILNGITMPLVYVAASFWMRTRWKDASGWKGAAWGLGEVFYGAVLWSALGGV